MSLSFFDHYQDTLENLLNILKGPHPPHAILLYGGQLKDQHRFALELSKLFLDAPKQSPEAHWIDQESHPQLLVVDAPSPIIPIEHLRQQLHHFDQRANGEPFVFILKGLHRLKLESANTLLKSLEEPSHNSLILALSHHRDQVLPTLKSRMLSFYIPPVVKNKLPKEQHFLWDLSQGSWHSLSTLASNPEILQKAQEAQAQLQHPEKRLNFLQKTLDDFRESESLLESFEKMLPLFYAVAQNPVHPDLIKVTAALESAMLEKKANGNSGMVLRKLELSWANILNPTL